MSKIFSCIFPYSKKMQQDDSKEDIQNTGFIQDNMNSSLCEMSYHHVDSVSKTFLQKRIQKLENEKEALVEMMIYQHENYKKSSLVQGKMFQKEKKKNNSSNYYSKLGKKSKYPTKKQEFLENTYDYIAFN
ncbi:hypothetical protein CRE_11690 [Caenorhabditis remanei]|uniref:Uncharacterized protein n=1 Tax=Caenorhabditis remanei TaxID=31234 RepID=E3M452_CAERE|nr:hypothetical protein CRE_11690 [Caenorhabditis remanei]